MSDHIRVVHNMDLSPGRIRGLAAWTVDGQIAAMEDEPALQLRPQRADLILRAIRQARRWSQRQLAAEAGVSKSTVARAELGKDISLFDFLWIVSMSGYRLRLVDDADMTLLPPAWEEARDRSGRRLPAHANIRTAAFLQWWADKRYVFPTPRPTHTYSLPPRGCAGSTGQRGEWGSEPLPG